MNRVRIKKGWEGAGRWGRALGEKIFVNQWWTPVIWDSEEDPEFHKTVGLEFEDNHT